MADFEISLFAEVGDLVRSMAPEGHGELRYRSGRGGVKVWFGPQKPTREHYEAQFIPRRHVDGGDGWILEIGFHAEHPKEPENEAVMKRLMAKKKVWTKTLGKQPVAGEFLGRDSWRRISELWPDTDRDDEDLAFEIASRVVDYIDAIEPIRAGD